MNVRRFGRALGRVLLFGGLALAALFAFGPREPVDLTPHFDPASLPAGAPAGLDAWLAGREAAYPDLRPGDEKRILWAGAPGQATQIALVYLHGFSASSEEIRPVPDQVARALGANLFYTRLSGHGRSGAAMAEPSVQDWVNDLAEAVAVGERLGEKVYLIGTSTGGTLAAVAANDPQLSPRIAGIVMISPNFGLAHRWGGLLTWPLARYWVPLILGREVGYDARVPAYAEHWTTRFPATALMPMAALARAAAGLDYFSVPTAALVLYSPDDRVVSVPAILEVAGQWSGPMVVEERALGPRDDPMAHILAGAVLSPDQSDETARLIADWIRSH